MQTFEQIYNLTPSVVSSAPGRANLIGEHTDYNCGFVLPFPLQYTAKISMAIDSENNSQDSLITMVSSLYTENRITRKLSDTKQNHWTDYIVGSLQTVAKQKKVSIPSLKVYLKSDIPVGFGVSSSAALEVATIRSVIQLLGLQDIDNIEIAKLAKQTENEYIGMPCGIMDQFVSAVGKPHNALLLDCKNLQYENILLNTEYDWAVLKSGISHQLVNSEYAKRVERCQNACKLLNIKSLREVTIDDLDQINKLPLVEQKRARHVVTENNRVLQAAKALKQNDMKTLCKLLLESHESQKLDYEITIPETDAMVKDAVSFGACAARQTGGGFGGSLIIVLRKGDRQTWWQLMKKKYPKTDLI